MGEIKFGTDGWRGVIAEDFTFANVVRVAQAAADYWRANPGPETLPRIVIGFDRRFLSDEFARVAAGVFAGNGFEVLLAPDPVPTPAISFAVKASSAVGGVMITASHNPPKFNGFKLKSYFGGSAPPEVCQAVEGRLDKSPVSSMPVAEAIASGRLIIHDPRPAYYRAIKQLVDFKLISRSRLRIAHEAMFGSAAGCFEALLRRTNCVVTTLNSAHDPLFGGINPEPIQKNYIYSRRFLKQHPQDICIATDGDGDRIGGMDGHGGYLTTHQIICLILYHLLENRRQTGRVVKALTTTSMVDKICADHGLALVETGVGFKYVCAEMLKGGVLLGAEESGGIGFAGHIPERDGLAAGLFLLELLATEKRSVREILSRLRRKYGPHEYGRIDVQFPLEKRTFLVESLKTNPPERLCGLSVTEMKTFDGVKMIASDGSWLMLRASGTEPIVRIYAEAPTKTKVNRLLEFGLALARQLERTAA